MLAKNPADAAPEGALRGDKKGGGEDAGSGGKDTGGCKDTGAGDCNTGEGGKVVVWIKLSGEGKNGAEVGAEPIVMGTFVEGLI